MQWFYAQNNQQAGPVSQAELDQLAQTGVIHPETLVWREGLANWQPYRTVRVPPSPPAVGGLPPLIDQALCAECQRAFAKSDLIRYENLFVCATCKPIFFQKLQEGITPGGSAAVWRSGKFLVMRKDATLPNRCVKCDADAPGEKLPRKLFWHHPAVYLLILPGLLIYAIIATVIGKRAKIQIGLCREHRERRKRNLLIAWGLFLSSIACFIGGGMLANGWIVGFGIVALIASPIYGMITCPMVTPKKIDDQFVWLNGVSPKFLDSLSEFPGRR
jgi:hypothetical protein